MLLLELDVLINQERIGLLGFQIIALQPKLFNFVLLCLQQVVKRGHLVLHLDDRCRHLFFEFLFKTCFFRQEHTRVLLLGDDEIVFVDLPLRLDLGLELLHLLEVLLEHLSVVQADLLDVLLELRAADAVDVGFSEPLFPLLEFLGPLVEEVKRFELLVLNLFDEVLEVEALLAFLLKLLDFEYDLAASVVDVLAFEHDYLA